MLVPMQMYGCMSLDNNISMPKVTYVTVIGHILMSAHITTYTHTCIYTYTYTHTHTHTHTPKGGVARQRNRFLDNTAIHAIRTQKLSHALFAGLGSG